MNKPGEDKTPAKEKKVYAADAGDDTQPEDTEETEDEVKESTEETGGSAENMPEAFATLEQLSETDFYVVKKGDTLDTISIDVYGDRGHVDAICKMNGLKDGNLIYIGQKLLLP